MVFLEITIFLLHASPKEEEEEERLKLERNKIEEGKKSGNYFKTIVDAPRMAMLPFSRCQVQAKVEPSLANDQSIDRSTPSSVTRNNGRLRVRKVNHLPSRPPTGRRACAPRSENKRINFSFVSWRSISRWKIICNNPHFEMNRRKCFQIIKILSTPRGEEVEKKIFAPCIGNQPCAYPKDWRCAQDYLQINHEYKIRKEKMILETFHSKLPNLMMNEPNICLDISVENPCISCLAPCR